MKGKILLVIPVQIEMLGTVRLVYKNVGMKLRNVDTLLYEYFSCYGLSCSLKFENMKIIMCKESWTKHPFPCSTLIYISKKSLSFHCVVKQLLRHESQRTNFAFQKKTWLFSLS